MSAIDVKANLRRIFRAARSQYVANLSEADLHFAFSNLPSPLAALCTAGKIVAGYIAVGSEADPMRLMQAAEERGCSLALPYVVGKTQPMRFLRWSGSDALEPGPFGLLQPKADAAEVRPDIVLTPLVAFDGNLMRLGQGAGHYDRALSVLERATTVGIAWSVQQSDALPADPWDMPLDAVLTEKSWISR